MIIYYYNISIQRIRSPDIYIYSLADIWKYIYLYGKYFLWYIHYDIVEIFRK